MPKKGRAIITIDYSQQEFLLAGLLSGDKSMIEAYKSGDVYLYTAKLMGIVPKDGERKDYEFERNCSKSTTLGIQYGMGAKGLARKLTQDTGVKHSVEQAETFIRDFNSTYDVYSRWKEDVIIDYEVDGYLKLPCGWTIFGDNKNKKSVQNFPLQGLGASIMRKGVELCQDDGLDVILTLHDALYVECDSDIESLTEAVSTMYWCLFDAFRHYFIDTDQYENSEAIRMDVFAWSEGYPTKTIQTDLCEFDIGNMYLEGGEADYERFKKYF